MARHALGAHKNDGLGGGARRGLGGDGHLGRHAAVGAVDGARGGVGSGFGPGALDALVPLAAQGERAPVIGGGGDGVGQEGRRARDALDGDGVAASTTKSLFCSMT